MSFLTIILKILWTRGQSGYPRVACRGRVEALGIRIESERPKVLPVRRLFLGKKKLILVGEIKSFRFICSSFLEILLDFFSEI